MKILVLLAALVLAISPSKALDKRPILLVLTNHGELGNTGQKTGFYLGEAAHPWEVFEKSGYPVRLASPQGGFAPVDPKSLDLTDPANAAFWKKFGSKHGGREGVAETLPLAGANPGDFSGIFFAGGHGTMWDFADSPGVKALTAKIYDQGGVVGAVCHGPASLVHVKLGDGSALVSGKKVAVFTNAEEEAVELTDVVPFLLETELTKAGAQVVPAPNFQENAIRDGRLVTGQNPASAKKAAELFVEALSQPNEKAVP